MQKIKEDKRKMEWLELSIKYAILGLTGALTSTGVLIVIGITDTAVCNVFIHKYTYTSFYLYSTRFGVHLMRSSVPLRYR